MNWSDARRPPDFLTSINKTVFRWAPKLSEVSPMVLHGRQPDAPADPSQRGWCDSVSYEQEQRMNWSDARRPPDFLTSINKTVFRWAPKLSKSLQWYYMAANQTLRPTRTFKTFYGATMTGNIGDAVLKRVFYFGVFEPSLSRCVLDTIREDTPSSTSAQTMDISRCSCRASSAHPGGCSPLRRSPIPMRA